MKLELVKTNEEIIECFYSLRTKSDVADLLEIPIEVLNYYLYISSNYTIFTIPKRDGSPRVIYSPITPIKILQRKLLYVFNLIYEPDDNSFGFIKNRSIVQNAARHQNKKYVLNIDLKDYFPNITFGRILGYLKKNLMLGDEASVIITKLACVETEENTFLPPGSPLSPILSNMISRKLDVEISNFVKKYDCTYSRYADDISISTDRIVFPEQVAIRDLYGDIWLNAKFVKVISDNDFNINYRKVRLRSNKQRQEVTGLIVNGVRPNVKREYIRNLRAMIFDWEKNGLENAQSNFEINYWKPKDSDFKQIPRIENVIDGKLNFLSMVRGKDDLLYQKLKTKYDKLVSI
ncbi:RNA-directed DNA polymerase [Leptospira yasudae]|uniref:reverse transcriptase domain-containing protein n=1 Tax=Leptospira yasudae TaxID=2202201 RepID=UPI001C4EF3E8|nr:reverse transcriptase domain-containing protein [Leptospira yasudae]MBW0435212.1 RNA-directed DNA polymerase [Leptospira yasudae]